MTDAIDYLEGYLKGKSDGRKEVVGWLKNNITYPYPVGSSGYSKWQKKKKQWGI